MRPATPEQNVDASAVTLPVTPEMAAAAEKLRARRLCPECFGRVFGRAGHGLTNPERAARIGGSNLVTPSEGTDCELCLGAFHRYEVWVRRALEAAQGYEWHRFTCGSRWDPELLAREETIWTEVGSAWGESARTAFNRELGKRIAVAFQAEGTTGAADLVFLVDLPAGLVHVTVQPIYLRGRYRKLDRTLPQTRWPCRRCHGRGCDFCHGSGKMYSESVEELVAAPVLAATGGEGTRFHGMGREDIDARMLGRGRPFVLEVLRPHQRSLDPGLLARTINSTNLGRVEVLDLESADAGDVERVKSANPTKSYRVVVSGEVPEAKINEALELVLRRAIAQRTPKRVAHRRADRVRTRRIVEARLVSRETGRFTLDLRAEAGTYIKEWVEGDGGRTDPNLASLLDTPLSVEALDVLEIHDQE
jgi:tRNA pseudouridine synthase 10